MLKKTVAFILAAALLISLCSCGLLSGRGGKNTAHEELIAEKLNGFWEEGYHYYIEIRDGRMTVRGYRRDVVLETEISYDADAVERGERTVITPKESVLSRDFEGKPFTMIKELAWESGELKFLYYYTIMGETLYTLKKTDRGPFDHIIIRDEEFLPKLQGEWVEWSRSGKSSNTLVIKGDRLSTFGIDPVLRCSELARRLFSSPDSRKQNGMRLSDEAVAKRKRLQTFYRIFHSLDIVYDIRDVAVDIRFDIRVKNVVKSTLRALDLRRDKSLFPDIHGNEEIHVGNA